MSVQAITWAYEQVELEGVPRFVLVTLANRADEDWSCYPSVAILQRDTGYKDRAIRNALEMLETNGYLTRQRQRNPDGSLGRYRFYLQRHRMPLGVLAAVNAGGRKTAKKPEQIHRPAPDAARKPTGTSCQNPTGTSCRTTKPNKQDSNRQTLMSDAKMNGTGLTTAFDVLWALWPAKGRERSKARDKVRDAFAKAVEHRPPELLIEAARKFVAKTEAQYVPALNRWLEQGRYENFLPVDQAKQPGLFDSDAQWAARLKVWLTNGSWPQDAGPKPDEPGYSGPADQLEAILVRLGPDHPTTAIVRSAQRRKRSA